jgi:LysM repeat protein
MREENEIRRSELIKFGILAIILLGAVLLVAVTRPLIFGQIVPAVIGQGERSAPLSTDAEQPAKVTPTLEETDPLVTATQAATPVTPEATEEAEESLRLIPTVRHVVQPGENLTTIAETYNVTVDDIIMANNITDPNRIEAGTVLRIPPSE